MQAAQILCALSLVTLGACQGDSIDVVQVALGKVALEKLEDVAESVLSMSEQLGADDYVSTSAACGTPELRQAASGNLHEISGVCLDCLLSCSSEMSNAKEACGMGCAGIPDAGVVLLSSRSQEQGTDDNDYRFEDAEYAYGYDYFEPDGSDHDSLIQSYSRNGMRSEDYEYLNDYYFEDMRSEDDAYRNDYEDYYGYSTPSSSSSSPPPPPPPNHHQPGKLKRGGKKGAIRKGPMPDWLKSLQDDNTQKIYETSEENADIRDKALANYGKSKSGKGRSEDQSGGSDSPCEMHEVIKASTGDIIGISPGCMTCLTPCASLTGDTQQACGLACAGD